MKIRKFCPPPLIILMDFLFIFLFILLYTSTSNTRLKFSLPDDFPDDFITENSSNNGIKIACPEAYKQCDNLEYLYVPNELKEVIAKVVLDAFLPPSNCKTLKIPLTERINGRTLLDHKKLIKINKCLRDKNLN